MNETAIKTERRSWWRASDATLVNPRTVLALVAVSLTWAFSLTGLQRHLPGGLPASVQAWARECPDCGTVESLATLAVPRPAGRDLAAHLYRLTIRMADGSIRRFEQDTPIAPGSQVRVQGGTVRPVAGSPAPGRRQ